MLQRVGVWCGLPPDRLQRHSDMWQVSSVFLEPGERRAGQEAGAVWGEAPPDCSPNVRSIPKRHSSRLVGANSIMAAWGCELMLCWCALSTSHQIKDVCLIVFPQKQEKPKFVLCVTFAENGNTITGDSSGNILAWGKGMLMNSEPSNHAVMTV